ncbi:MAG: hypothetical protein EP329_03565 [Deltaproteobacteria bacterium]|nr:MAG: hypothetical protein EP329_03565 [Deltaproteobacteria bacterium]
MRSEHGVRSRRWGAIALLLAAAGCGDDATRGDVEGTDAADVVANPAGCPESHPVMTGADRHFCPLEARGATCAWAAPGCTAGERPANSCACDDTGWHCSAPFRSCLPITDGGQLALGERPAPRRVATAACEAVDAGVSGTCAPRYFEDGTSTCASDGECDAGAVCLDTHTFGAGSVCSCHTPACTTHDDCGDGYACKCGALDAGAICGGVSDLSCGHQCLPAACRSDADCGDGGLCAASPGICGWPTLKYACHHLDRDECLSDAECLGGVCRHDEVRQAWVCDEMPLCE